MRKKLTWVLLVVPLSGWAADKVSSPAYQAALAAFEKAKGLGFELLNCEGVERLSNFALHYAPPPPSCPRVGKYYDYVAKADRTLRTKCREYSAWATKLLSDPAHCSEDRDALRKKGFALRDASVAGFDLAGIREGNLPAEFQHDFWGYDRNHPPSELENDACLIPFRMVSGLESSEQGIADALYRQADFALQFGCKNPEDIKKFLSQARRGDREDYKPAAPAKNDKTPSGPNSGSQP